MTKNWAAFAVVSVLLLSDARRRCQLADGFKPAPECQKAN